MTILLKQNSEAIRESIRQAGIKLCECTRFVDAVWLDYNPGVTDSVHGLGYPMEGMTKEETIAFIEHEWSLYGTRVVECKDVEEFITKIKEITE